MNKCLMYHSIGSGDCAEAGAELYAVTVEQFKKQMAYLGTVPIRGGDSPFVTFDDGLLDNYTQAFPILQEYGLKAYFFIMPLKVGTPGYMHWEQIKALKNAGMVIGSHGMTHRILTELNSEELDDEIKASKKMLEENLGKTVDYFSIPRGFYNQEVIARAKAAGYLKVFTSNPKDNDDFKIGRIPVKGEWSLDYFMRVLNNGLSLKDRAGELVKSSSKRILGPKWYDRIRTSLLK